MSFSTQFAENTSPFDVDQATLSNYTEIRTTHIDLDWTIDWDRQVIFGHANLKLQATKDTDVVVLDSSYLDVKAVHVGGEKATWAHGERIGAMGEGLKIDLKQGLKAGQVSVDTERHVGMQAATDCSQEIEVKIVYSTTKNCTAVGWLNPVYVLLGLGHPLSSHQRY